LLKINKIDPFYKYKIDKMDKINEITIYCVGDQSNRWVAIHPTVWMHFLNIYLEKNKNLHENGFLPYRKLENHPLYYTLYDELERWLYKPTFKLLQ
jgi:hypothetical protein